MWKPVAMLAALPSSSSFHAQDLGRRVPDSNFCGWFMYFGDHPISRKWEVRLEGQWRRHQVVSRWQQLLLRPALNCGANFKLTLSGGYTYVKSHPYGHFPARDPFPEHRISQQVLLRDKSGHLDIRHRYRLEQRFIGQMLRSPAGPWSSMPGVIRTGSVIS